jgi:hypothetical protein
MHIQYVTWYSQSLRIDLHLVRWHDLRHSMMIASSMNSNYNYW